MTNDTGSMERDTYKIPGNGQQKTPSSQATDAVSRAQTHTHEKYFYFIYFYHKPLTLSHIPTHKTNQSSSEPELRSWTPRLGPH